MHLVVFSVHETEEQDPTVAESGPSKKVRKTKKCPREFTKRNAHFLTKYLIVISFIVLMFL